MRRGKGVGRCERLSFGILLLRGHGCTKEEEGNREQEGQNKCEEKTKLAVIFELEKTNHGHEGLVSAWF